jgi:hypothetical protein
MPSRRASFVYEGLRLGRYLNARVRFFGAKYSLARLSGPVPRSAFRRFENSLQRSVIRTSIVLISFGGNGCSSRFRSDRLLQVIYRFLRGRWSLHLNLFGSPARLRKGNRAEQKYRD